MMFNFFKSKSYEDSQFITRLVTYQKSLISLFHIYFIILTYLGQGEGKSVKRHLFAQEKHHVKVTLSSRRLFWRNCRDNVKYESRSTKDFNKRLHSYFFKCAFIDTFSFMTE
jgi:hypothetical protein